MAFNKVSENSVSPINAVLQNVIQIGAGLVIGMVIGVLMFLFNSCRVKTWVKSIVCIFVVLIVIITSELFAFHESKFIAIVIFGYLCHRIWKEDKP